MPVFNYTAIDKQGKETKGRLEVGSHQEAIDKVREKGLYPISISEEKGRSELPIDAKGTGKPSAKASFMTILIGGVTQKQMTLFTRQLATLIASGLPLVRSLYVLERQERSAMVKSIMHGLAEQVESGSSFSEALSKYPRTFPSLYVNTVKAGETGGVLEVVLARLADFAEKTQKLTSRIKAALIYPILVLILAMTILSLLMIFIVPNFRRIFVEMNVDLPAVTKILFATSTFMKEKWYFGAFIIVVLAVAFRFMSNIAVTRFILDRIKLELPVFGQLLRKIAVARFTRTLGTLLSSGVPILQALMVAKDTTGNEVIVRSITKVHNSVREGETVAKPLLKAGVFPPMAVNMISVGEETGALDQMLLKIADVYDEEVDVTVSGLMSLLEPFLIIGMGLIVGFIVVSMFLPLFQLIQTLGGG